MRTILAAFGLVLTLSSVAAQTSTPASVASSQFQRCLLELRKYEAELQALQDEAAILENSLTALNQAWKDALGSIGFIDLYIGWDPKEQELKDIKEAFERQSARLQRIKRSIATAEYWLKIKRENCDFAAQQNGARIVDAGRRQRNETLIRNIQAAKREVTKNTQRARQDAARFRRDLAELRRKLATRSVRAPGDIALGRRRWPGIELYADLGGSFGHNAPRLDNFGQTLVRGSDFYGSAGIALSLRSLLPLAPTPMGDPWSTWDIRVGSAFVHNASTTDRVQNDAGGFLATRGHFDTNAALGTVGLRLRPFDTTSPLGRIGLGVDGGYGRAWHNVSVFNQAGAQVIRSSASSNAWLVRGSMIYQVNDWLGVGFFVSHMQSGGITAHLANGQPFAMSTSNNTSAGVTLVFGDYRASSTVTVESLRAGYLR